MIEQLKESPAFYKGNGKPNKYPFFYDKVCGLVKINGLWLEFGTGAGQTLSHIHRHTPQRIYTFDWFKGLPEDWVESQKKTHPAGSFGLEKKDPDNIAKFIAMLEKRYPKARVISGLFADTLPGFINEHDGNVAFLHIDCDLYSSTKTVLTLLAERIVPGTVILFDELWGYENYEQCEYRALKEFIDATGYKVEFVAHVANARQAALVIKSNKESGL